MQATIINMFIDATLHVLATLGGGKFTVQKPHLKTDAAPSGEVTGVILLLGEVDGSVALSFERGCVLQIVSSMLGEDIRELNQDIQDAVGEITNMVSGQAAQKLGDVTPRIEIRPDVVLMGQGAIPGQTRGAAVVAVALVGPGGRLTLEVCWPQ
ncbi:MAG: chemotaxis protein CheX [Desulfobacterales bacterium]